MRSSFDWLPLDARTTDSSLLFPLYFGCRKKKTFLKTSGKSGCFVLGIVYGNKIGKKRNTTPRPSALVFLQVIGMPGPHLYLLPVFIAEAEDAREDFIHDDVRALSFFRELSLRLVQPLYFGVP